MATKMVNGVEVQMSPQEEADFEASRALTLPMAKALAKRIIVARAKLEQNEESLLEAANPGARITAVRTNARALWAAVKACNSVAEVRAIDLDAGW